MALSNFSGMTIEEQITESSKYHPVKEKRKVIVVYSVNKPTVKADKYFCISKDIEKILSYTHKNCQTDWMVDEEDINATYFLDILKVTPSDEKGIHIKSTDSILTIEHSLGFFHLDEIKKN